MIKMRFGNRKITIPVSPFMMLGVLLVLLPLFTYMTLDRMEKQKEQIREQVLVRGISLIRTFEAGTRTGMLAMQWGAQRVQAMLTETAAQPDVSYIMITDREGNILAHSNPDEAGGVYEDLPDMIPVREEAGQVFSRVRRNSQGEVFEVYKRFIPLSMGFRGRHRMHPGRPGEGPPGPDRFHGGFGGKPERFPGMPGGMAGGGMDPGFAGMEEHYIFAGISLLRMEEMGDRMARLAIGRGIVFFFIGCAGVIALFAFQAYRSARASLDRVKAFSDNVVQNMPSGLMTLDTRFHVTSANQAARHILGEDLPETAFPQMIQMAHDISGTGRPLSREVTLRPGTEEALKLDMTAALILGDEGKTQGYMFLFRDLTRIKELIQEVETNRRLAAIGKLAGGVAHEIRNPLSSIKGFATYFAKRYADNPDDAGTAKIMVQEVERINRSITQLLEFADPMAVERREVAIDPLIRHSLKLLSHDLKREKISTRVNITTAHARMHTDPDRMNQVLLNLYMNAVNAMEPEGTLSVTVSDLPLQPGIEIRVADDGCGIAPELLEDIFDPYFTTRADGTGLGLSIVHRIVENLKGEIRVESEPGKGSCFIISLPGAVAAGDAPKENIKES